MTATANMRFLSPASEYQLQQAMSHHHAGRLQQAEQLYRSVLQAHPLHPDANHNLGVLTVQVGQPAGALACFKAALAADPKQGQYWLSYVDALMRAGQPDAARQALAEARQNGLRGERMDALAAMLGESGRSPASLGDNPSRKPQSRSAAALPQKKTSGKAPDPNELNRVVALFNGGHLPQCEQAARALTQRFPKHGFGWKVLGLVLMQQGRATEALPAMQKTAALFPDEADAHYNLGVALMALGRHAEAEAVYRRALRLNPHYVEALGNLGNVLAEQRNFAEAEACYRKLLQLGVNIAEAHNNLGNALKEQGRHDEAEASYRRALELDPDYADGCNNLGAVLVAQKKYAEAEACYQRALTLRQDYAEAHSGLCAVLAEQCRYTEAEASCLRALELQPDFAEAYNNFSIVLKEQYRYVEAEASCRRALEFNPDCAETHRNLGNILSAQGDLAGAKTSYLRALELKPGCADALVGMGNVASGNGQFMEAETCFRRALEIEPEMPEAWSALAGIRKMTPDDADWIDVAKKIVLKDIAPKQESAMRYAMGKFCDDVRDYDHAFAYYRRANELRKAFSEAYDRQAHAERVDAIIQSYPYTRTHTVHESASDSMRPLLIVGMPRSGTSLTEQIIASHPATFGAGELHFWGDAAAKLAPGVALDELDEKLLRILADECLRNLDRFSADAQRVVDKMPGNFSNVGLIHTVFPNARILHTQRNPIDTCLSIYFQNFPVGHSYASDLEDLAHYYKEYHRLMAHWRSVLPPEVFLDVPYEALVEDQEGWSRKIIEFIGLEWNDACLNFHETERKVGTASNWQVRQKIYKSSKERWRNYEKHVGPLLELLELYQPAIAR